MTTSFVFFDKWGHQEMVTGYLWGPFPNKFEGLGSNICSENPIKLFVFSRCFSPDWSGNTMDLRFPSDQPFQQACPVIPLGLWPSWSKPQETQKNHWCWWFGTWLLVSISYMGCHPSRWRTPSFFKMGTLHHQPVIDVESLLKTCLFFVAWHGVTQFLKNPWILQRAGFKFTGSLRQTGKESDLLRYYTWDTNP